MRRVLSALLIGLIATCPIVCGTAHDPASDDGHHHSSRDNGTSPAPVNDDYCVCNGALACSPENASHCLGLDFSNGFCSWDIPCALIGWLSTIVDESSQTAQMPDPGETPPLQRGAARLPFLLC